MAQRGDQLDRETFCCSICLDLLKDPVAIPCGHSYCMSCIKGFWDGEDQRKIYSCPQCRKTFAPRPVLMKNTILAALVEQLKNTGLQAAPADHCYAGPEDVACDVCTGRKLKAFKSCLTCLISYCENHLQPHYTVGQLKKHKLVDPSKTLQENICSCHGRMMEIFCRTDQQSICYLCSVDEHKGHDTVSAAAERTERQRELEMSRLNIKQRIQDREKDVKLLQQEVEVISYSADKAVEDSEKIFTQLIRLLQERSSDVKQQIRSQQQTEVSRVTELQEKLQQEITELKRKDAELNQLSHTKDHNQFLHNYPSVSQLSEPTDSSSINIRPLRYFEDVTAAVSELREKLQDILRDKWTNMHLARTEVDVLLPQPEPKTRAEFLKYSCKITMDPNTANTKVLLLEGNRKAEAMSQQQSCSSHPDRFTGWSQVLSRESLTGRCYWEVDWRGTEIRLAVAYKNISRVGSSNECGFGFNDKSWMLICYTTGYDFYFNNIKTPISGPCSSRVGVYLDHRAGILSFYSVSETMTLLHRVQTTFTQPLYAGLCLYYDGVTAELHLQLDDGCNQHVTQYTAAFTTESYVIQIRGQTCFTHQEVKLRQSLPLTTEMAQRGELLDRETFCCSICLELLIDPVAIPCGHSYCMSCIEKHWDGEDQRRMYSCPQCRQTFAPRPVLKKNTMLAALVEQLKKTGLQVAPADHCYAGLERQRELEVSRLNIQQRIQDREKDVKLLQQEVEAVSRSADKAVQDSEKIFTELICVIQKKSSDVRQQIRSQQETEVSRVKELQEKLQQEITELKNEHAELMKLSHTEDHNQFLHNYPSVSQLSEPTDSSSINIRPLRYFEDVTAAVSELRDLLLDILRDKWTNISATVTEVDVLPSEPEPEPEPKTRAEFLRYSCEITLDPNTAHTKVLLSEGNRKATYTTQQQSYSSHPDRFTYWPQVLSRESLTERCYWEVDWRGTGAVGVAVAYKTVSRGESSNECGFGYNDNSWMFVCHSDGYTFYLNTLMTPISGPCSSRVGVYLDHRAGILSFYSVSETMTLLHRVQTIFTQPLYAGLCVYYGATTEFCQLE
ncbi:uncharacterized protein LOC128377477 [Scomber japonicus]|uniref:uncharacterized protein LOC128377477 n=1 Tax=Scomber japonicus TaxID=13676 RepID=UPI0023059F1A|nr:uncharacterized protein LOC128377477 [Scomber japonicus]